jgi:hypothetical protein
VPWDINSTKEDDTKPLNEEVIPRVRAFMGASKERQAFMEKKVREQLAFFEVEKEHYGFGTARRVTKLYANLW